MTVTMRDLALALTKETLLKGVFLLCLHETLDLVVISCPPLHLLFLPVALEILCKLVFVALLNPLIDLEETTCSVVDPRPHNLTDTGKICLRGLTVGFV